VGHKNEKIRSIRHLSAKWWDIEEREGNRKASKEIRVREGDGRGKKKGLRITNGGASEQKKRGNNLVSLKGGRGEDRFKRKKGGGRAARRSKRPSIGRKLMETPC